MSTNAHRHAIDRRTFVVASGAAVAQLARPRRPALGHGHFPQGVAAGRPGLHGTTVWTRVEGAERSGTIVLEVARDAGFANVVDRRRVWVTGVRDHTARLRLEDPRIYRPGEEYHYRFATPDADSPVGRFRTARPADSREPVRVGFFSCQNWQSGYYTAHAGMAAERDLDLVVCVGDYIYEAASDPGPREDRIGPDRSAQTHEEYRQKYRLYRSDPQLQALHAAHPFVACWDDHEVMSSYYDLAEGNRQGRDARVPFPLRRRNAYLAFVEHMPLSRPGPEPTRIYQAIRLGAHAEVVLTDLHQFADPPPDCAGVPTIGPVLLAPCRDSGDPSRDLLGDAQRRWFLDVVAGSTATWKLWGSSMMLMGLDVVPGVAATTGEWSGWEGARNALADALRRRGVRNLAAFSGDIHSFFAGSWTTTGRSDGPPAGVEFVSGSMTSSGIGDALGGAAVANDLLRLLNPHLAHAETLRRGYAVATATADELRVDFRSPRTVAEPASPVETIASFRVADGRPVVEPVR